MPKYTLELGDEFDTMLTEWAKKKGISKSELIRYAMASYIYLQTSAIEKGLKVSITNNADKVIKDVMLP